MKITQAKKLLNLLSKHYPDEKIQSDHEGIFGFYIAVEEPLAEKDLTRFQKLGGQVTYYKPWNQYIYSI